MKILFVYPNIGQIRHYNHGIGILSAVLKQKGYSVDLIILEKEEPASFIKAVAKKRPDVICFSITSHYWEVTKRLSSLIKSNFRIPIFCGGIHPTVFPRSIEETKDIDGVCVGEGEFPLSEVADCIKEGRDYTSVDNFWFRKGDRIVKNPVRPLIEDLNMLPIPDREIFPDEYVTGYPTFIFSRDCPYSCSYCCNEALKRIYKDKGKRVRFRSVDRALEEIGLFLKRYKVDYIGFDDDSFTKNKKWLEEFCNKYSANKGLPPIACNTRPEIFTEHEAKLLKKAGCFKINMGIESGSERLRKDVLNRHMTNRQIINSFKIAKEHDMSVFSFNMIGFPGETKRDFYETIRLNRLIVPDFIQITMFYPYPGTRLGDYALEKGFAARREMFNYFFDSVMEIPGFPRREIIISRILFRFNVYRKALPKKAVYCLISDTAKYVESRNKYLKRLLSILRDVRRTVSGRSAL
jgi:anaerobic magnesium-protoporphyrin IX monomethyl ester cyclase